MSDQQQLELPLEEVFQSPESLEAAMVAKEQEKEVHNPADVAAAMFHRRFPILQGLVKQLSMKELKRLIMNVASYPLADDKYAPKTQIEKDAAYHFSELVNEKMIMQLYLEQEKAFKKMEESQTPKEGEQSGQ